MFSKLASFTFGVLVVTNGRAVPAAPVSAAQDVRELLVAARGVAPSLCTLAAIMEPRNKPRPPSRANAVSGTRSA